ncbi:MAG: S8 family serine peptidase [Candidatus Cryptobacteroides sp.]
MKRAIKIIITLILSAGIISCTKEEKVNDPVAGSWHLMTVTNIDISEIDVYLSFEQGNFTLFQKMGEGRYRKYDGTYFIEGNVLHGSYSGGEKFGSDYRVQRDKDRLTLTSDSGESSIYTLSQIPDEVTGNAIKPLKSGDWQQNVIRVKVTPGLADSLENAAQTKSTGEIGIESFKELTQAVKVTSVERTFPNTGRFESRRRAEGLHQWYDIHFEGDGRLDEVEKILGNAGTVLTVEKRPVIMNFGNDCRYAVYDMPAAVSTDASAVFDDPVFPEQWHYYNDGTSGPAPEDWTGAVKWIRPKEDKIIQDCDVNVMPVWKSTKYNPGNPAVVVAVTDGGVDGKHIDLADNMWHDPETGAFGYNFVRKNDNVTADNHATHVAGTIAAVNNNGIGVCGLAGGDAKKGIKGVKIMSCQIFEGNTGVSETGCFVWACDHGANISQNSWGYQNNNFILQSDKEGIDYFIKYAGCDENGDQLPDSPMKGGIVIFAAGNDSRNWSYPAQYEPCLAVGAVASDYEASYFSNYGDWVDVSAPGGDEYKDAWIISTYPGDKVAGMQGTSMACPHVSGIAALIVSNFGGQGYTADRLRSTIEASCDNFSGFNQYIKIGKGIVNVYKAFMIEEGKTQTPGRVENFKASNKSNKVDYSFTVPACANGSCPKSIRLYRSNLGSSRENVLKGKFTILPLDGYKPGDKYEGTLYLPDFDMEYYLAATAVDEARFESADLSDVAIVAVDANNPPVIEGLSDLNIEMEHWQTAIFEFKASDADGHNLTARLNPSSNAAAFEWLGNGKLRLSIDGTKLTKTGKTNATVSVSDGFGGKAEIKISYNVKENHAPVVGTPMDNYSFGSLDEKWVVDGATFFTDQDGEELSLEAEITPENIVSTEQTESGLTLTPLAFGTARAIITATDAFGESISQEIMIVVRDGTRDIDVYPNPARANLYIRADAKSKIDVEIVATNGAVALSRTFGAGTVSLYNPGIINIVKLKAGTYSVRLKYDGATHSHNIVKL